MVGFCQVSEEAVEIGNADLVSLLLACEFMTRVTDQYRSNSKLLEFVELFLSRPPVKVTLGVKLIT